ncbi:MAG TPA: hypothetical protein VNQ57_11345 [Ureibacillus sp.]|nr:hypothetical protein [Ureibacillus sp.]
MVVSIVIILIISQLICFYSIVILNTKIAKFKDLEKRQDQLIREMDDAISLYLVEMKEENDRLIQELSSIKQTEFKDNEIKNQKLAMMDLEDEEVSPTAAYKEKSSTEEVKLAPKAYIPKKVVRNAYKLQNPVEEVPVPLQVEEKSVLPAFEQKVLELHRQGKSIDEIAKITQKGKTEIDLLIKFHG